MVGQNVIVWGHIDIPTHNMDAALQLSLEHVRQSRKEPGCISHSVNLDAENLQRLTFFEEWQTITALQAHFKVTASREFVRKLSKLASSQPTMLIYESTLVDL